MASGDDLRLITSCLAPHRAPQGAPTAIVELSIALRHSLYTLFGGLVSNHTPVAHGYIHTWENVTDSAIVEPTTLDTAVA